jgi:hypothetical protein
MTNASVRQAIESEKRAWIVLIIALGSIKAGCSNIQGFIHYAGRDAEEYEKAEGAWWITPG